MPRYFFNFAGSKTVDPEGTQLQDASAAWEEAVAAFGEMLRSSVSDDFAIGEHWDMQVTDSDGAKVFTLSFEAT